YRRINGDLQLRLIDLTHGLFDDAVLLLAGVDQERIVDGVGGDAGTLQHAAGAPARGSAGAGLAAGAGIVERAAALRRIGSRTIAGLRGPGSCTASAPRTCSESTRRLTSWTCRKAVQRRASARARRLP